MDIYVIANPLLLHIVKGLRIGLRLDPRAVQMGMMRTRGPRTLDDFPHHLSDSREETWRGFPLLLGQNFVLVLHSVLGAALIGSWRLRKGACPP